MSLFSARTLSPKVVLLDGFNHQEIHTRGLRLHAAVAGSPSDPCIVLFHDAYGLLDGLQAAAPTAGKQGLPRYRRWICAAMATPISRLRATTYATSTAMSPA